jgi:hypothetical protein
MRRYVSKMLVLVLFITFSTSCKSTKEYANLAQAGTTYATAMDRLLFATQDIEIDATSERLLQDDALSNQSLTNYRNLSNENEKTLKLIVLLRAHVKLLSRYFGLLYELATSNAPERAKKAIGTEKTGIIGNLNAIGAEIRGTGVVTGGAAAAAGPITAAIVGGKIRGALKDELNARRETIERELVLQEELLKFLSTQINHDLAVIQETREQRLVIGPLTSTTAIASPDVWINNRRSVLTMKLTAQELATASDNIKKLREAFEDLVSGKLTLDRVNSLLADFESLLTIAEKLKS